MRMIDMDEESRESLREFIKDNFGDIVRRKDIPGVDTPVAFRLTARQVIGLVTTVVFIISGVASGVWWLSTREATFRNEMRDIRIEFKDEMVKLRMDFNSLVQTIRTDQHRDFQLLRDKVTQIEAKVPKEYPPPDWLEHVFRPLVRRVEMLEKKRTP